ncbi:MAG: hypothetical protein A3I44_00580 [Candidatus Sungbacteria bacterium RIFCSPLOWO2_02_FULL_51_17]|uniref:MBL fold metallo-hydrolase n=1 Tax=Candidatus Sungbacteria bacterium RIFCSPHIGHO2_02_FULL_51_29 TaxID=1802273 RepID=A0A1G2KWY9_9BACT|nr:MAG: hypothetical protein A3C16_03845 [Candidatus Sungbacteria bacterium RIFCSPHIGHO2_02_FULL_51_29]OHA10625.1 MAG: hypothetical protein A3I44_00580 [Candidatus Sungbacteria bacterium RIFCSPLOWO2_02_FULL_51_17]
MSVLFEVFGGGDRIGGSSYRYNRKVVVDHGIIQGEGKYPKYPMMPEGECPVFLLSHDHLDHCGGVAAFGKRHPEARFFMPKVSRRGLEIQLNDALNISAQQADIDTLKGQKPVPLPFDEEDVASVIARIKRDTSGKNVVTDKRLFTFESLPGFSLRAVSAGHKPGAAIFLMKFADGARWIHACDFSLEDHALTLGANIPADFHNPDGMTIECTYGSLARDPLPDRKTEEARIMSEMERVFRRGGKVLVPWFASTLQNMAIPCAKAGMQTYVDGKSTQLFTENYMLSSPWCENDRPFRIQDLPTMFGVRDRAHRDELIAQESSFVVCSSSGMLEGGPSVQWLEHLIGDHKNAIIVPGYQAPGTRGRALMALERGQDFEIVEERVGTDRHTEKKFLRPKRTTRFKIYADVIGAKLSGHSDGRVVAPWVAKINPKVVVTVHGEPEAHEGMARLIRGLNPNIRVISGVNGAQIEV